jgi:hypothetical protein
MQGSIMVARLQSGAPSAFFSHPADASSFEHEPPTHQPAVSLHVSVMSSGAKVKPARLVSPRQVTQRPRGSAAVGV